MTHQPSRRSFIAGASLLALAPVAAQAATAKGPAVASPSPRLQRAIALYDRANGQYERFLEQVETPAQEAYKAEVAAFPAEPEPQHEQVATTFINWEGKEIRLTTNSFFRSSADRVTNDPSWADMGDETWRQAHRELHALFQKRDAIIAQQEERRAAFTAAARERHQIDRILARSSILADRVYRLWEAVLNMPCDGLADVAAKVAFIERHDGEPAENEFACIAADIKRLATIGGEARA